MTYVRDVLEGRTDIELGQDDRHVLDALMHRWYGGKAWKERLVEGFRPLLTDADPKLRAAAVHFFCAARRADDGGAVLAAVREHPELFEGVPQPWYPDGQDLMAALLSALAGRAGRDPEAQAVVLAQALRPGRGAAVVATLVHANPRWVAEHAAELLQASPDALEPLLFNIELATARERGETGPLPQDLRQAVLEPLAEHLAEALPELLGLPLLRAFEGRGLELHSLILALGRSQPRATLQAWLAEVVPDEQRRRGFLPLLPAR